MLPQPIAMGKRRMVVANFERLQSAGKVKHLPVREFALDHIAQVHEAVEKGNSGTRMVIVMA
jgi:D-arabinose 1-dehydrogenase-like Zn-dependent alcohol dehydrogenase